MSNHEIIKLHQNGFSILFLSSSENASIGLDIAILVTFLKNPHLKSGDRISYYFSSTSASTEPSSFFFSVASASGVAAGSPA
jgi:hypothetical protein